MKKKKGGDEKKMGGTKDNAQQRLRRIALKIQGTNRKIRRVSAGRNGEMPSLTITAELKELGLKKGDWVLIGVENNKVVIEKVE